MISHSRTVWLWSLAQLVVFITALVSIASERATQACGAICGAYLLTRCVNSLVHRLNQARQQHQPVNLHIPPEHRAMVGLLIMAALSVAITALPEITTPQVLRLVVGISVCLAVRQGFITWPVPRISVYQLAAALLMGLGLSLALLSPFGVDWLKDKYPIPLPIYQIFPRLLSDGIHANVMAAVLALLLPVPLAQILFTTAAPQTDDVNTLVKPALIRWISIVAFCIMALVLVLTQSRGGLLGLACSSIALVFMCFRRLRIPLLGIGLFAVAVLAVSYVNPSLLPPALQRLAKNLFSVSESSSAELRYEAWQRGWYMVQDFPITGIGMGSYKVISDVMYPTFISPESLPHAHNLFLQIAVDLGMPGLAIWLALWFCVIRACVRMLRGASSHRAIAAGLFASQIAFGTHGLLDAPLWGIVRAALLVWIVWGVTLGLAAAIVEMPKEKTAGRSDSLNPPSIISASE